jgi:Mce-associated membrane protein
MSRTEAVPTRDDQRAEREARKLRAAPPGAPAAESDRTGVETGGTRAAETAAEAGSGTGGATAAEAETATGETVATATEARAGTGEAIATGETGAGTGESAESAEPGEAEAEAGKPAEARPAWLRLPVLLLAAAVLLAGAGAWFTIAARSAAANPATANLALTDVGATADVTSAVTLAMNRIFSYSYDRTDVTEKAAAAVLRGSAKDSYDRLFAQVREKAPQQKLVLTSRVSAIAVQDLRNGHARLLVFLDQSAVRADNNATDSAAAQLSVTAERTGDGWVVTALEPR